MKWCTRELLVSLRSALPGLPSSPVQHSVPMKKMVSYALCKNVPQERQENKLWSPPVQLVPKLTLAFIVSFSRHHHSFPCPSASTLVGVGWLPGGGDLVLHPKGSEPSRPCPYWAALAIVACSPTRGIEPLSFSCSPSCSHQIATLALRGNQSQLSPLPVICLLVHWRRIPKGPGSRCCFKFTRPIRSLLPLAI